MDILIEELDQSLWVAGVEKGRLVGLDVDPAIEQIRCGAVYWGKVARIDKAQDAAFIMLGTDLKAILYNRDIRIKQKDGSFVAGGEKAIGQVLTPGDMVLVQAKEGAIPSLEKQSSGVAENKCPRVSMNIVLPGRYLIYTPQNSENRLSQRIRHKAVREAMRVMLDGLQDKKGYILRSSAQDVQTDVLIREQKILHAIWDGLCEYAQGNEACLIMDGPDSIQRSLSDHANHNIERIEIVTMDHFRLVEDWCELFAPDLVTKIQPIELENAAEDMSLYDHHDIIGQIESYMQPYVLLPSGGSLIIQETAAFMAVDVNSGSDKSSKLSVNVEAAKEVLHQMRVRNLGGIVIVDFLKMKKKSDQEAVLKVLKDHADFDPCTVQIHGFTNLGLVEITRSRRTPSLKDRFESMVF